MKTLSDLAKLELESVEVLRAATAAAAALGELKGVTHIIPNEVILINTLSLQEAQASAAIENIVTTHDELFRSRVDATVNGPTKEVAAHADALRYGFELVRKRRRFSLRELLAVQKLLIGHDAGVRTQIGTSLKNNAGEIIYTPPPPAELPELLDDLFKFINDDANNLHPLIKMAVLHHQFESIHPFYDGNGRAGRVLNLLYLVLKGKLDLPVLYLSRHINRTKAEYYRLLQTVRDDEFSAASWRAWINYMLVGVTEIARETIGLIHDINAALLHLKHEIRRRHPKVYSQDLINALFKHPYTKISFLQAELLCTRLTASRKLELLTAEGFLQKERVGRNNYYINLELVRILMAVGEKNSQPRKRHV